ncbi:MAG: adenylosuccinate lyase [Bacilli bacterium]|mgnify:CR=1 FL=1|nr:adenylosuccinate lyase [Bacilli bacterium]
MSNNKEFNSPFSSRYASKKMLSLFSPDYKYTTWRKLWLSLAKAESKLGLPINQEQIKELEQHLTDIDYDVVSQKEKEVRHDVMAHIYAYGVVAPTAKSIIHLGATSCYVTDNADLIIYKEALGYVKCEIKAVIKNLIHIIKEYSNVPMLGYTHYQPAQLVTVGKRMSLYLQDLVFDLNEIDDVLNAFRFLGCRGTTGTEASFLELFNGDESKIDQMNMMIANDFGFDKLFDVAGQTYDRKLDSRIMHALTSIAETCSKFATDLRLLQHDRLLEEPYEDKQIGSSAMPYKHNPMRCERICSLARYVISNSMNPSLTSSSQWFERTLDDSANRRIVFPEAFLGIDAILRLMYNVTNGLVINKKIIEKQIYEYLPFIASENILMAAVKKGGDRQALHEVIRKCSNIATSNMKEGKECNLLSLLLNEKDLKLSADDMKDILEPSKYIGRASSQALLYVNKVEDIISQIDDINMEDISL